MLLELMSRSLGLNPRYIARLANNASHRYFHFIIAKADGSPRHIYQPAKPLKAIQRWLQDSVVATLPVHPAAAAYQKGSNIADHARRHLKGRFLLRLDLCDFFESITEGDLVAFLNDVGPRLPNEWSAKDTGLFVALVCRRGALTIGAVTSPGISNAICYRLDHQLTSKCQELEVTYSRYADDLFFSTTVPNVLGGIPKLLADTLVTLAYPKLLAINARKTRHTSRKRHRRVTGLVLANQGYVSLGRRLKRRIRSQVHLLDKLTPDEKARLAGMLAYVQDIEPEFFNRLVVKYGERAAAAARPPQLAVPSQPKVRKVLPQDEV